MIYIPKYFLNTCYVITPHGMGWVVNSEIRNGLKAAARGALYNNADVRTCCMKMQCKAVTSVAG